MPCHPDRVRANYHTIETDVYKDTRTDTVSIRVTITKARIASWSRSKALAVQGLAKQLYAAVEDALDA